jgi:hypothetical protein
METHGIVKGFDVLEHRYFGVIEVLIALEFGPFMLQRPEESFCNRDLFQPEVAHFQFFPSCALAGL